MIEYFLSAVELFISAANIVLYESDFHETLSEAAFTSGSRFLIKSLQLGGMQEKLLPVFYAFITKKLFTY